MVRQSIGTTISAAQILHENGFGLSYGIDITQVPESAAHTLQQSAQQLGVSATPAADLRRTLVADAALSTRIC